MLRRERIFALLFFGLMIVEAIRHFRHRNDVDVIDATENVDNLTIVRRFWSVGIDCWAPTNRII